ncbi:MAG: membrane lipoprotein lipid attachment site-containing protein, partial [Bacteroidales bacterium]|nr:membrane lipoprotein lipid attachment site-containing protein [Bacteroidales bacterium]
MKKILFIAIGAMFALTACNNQKEVDGADEATVEVEPTGLKIAYV